MKIERKIKKQGELFKIETTNIFDREEFKEQLKNILKTKQSYEKQIKNYENYIKTYKDLIEKSKKDIEDMKDLIKRMKKFLSEEELEELEKEQNSQ